MTDEDVRAAWGNDRGWTSEWDQAIDDRMASLPTCTDQRLAELLELATAIDCYYGHQCDFLGACAGEAARRLRR